MGFLTFLAVGILPENEDRYYGIGCLFLLKKPPLKAAFSTKITGQ
jgi:hypothetical protein